jgi:predicted  nucleic acid-binding Zn-ribbon protein
MRMLDDYKKDINNSLKEIQNTSKQVKELNKTIQDLKMEVETIKKSQRKTTLEIENLGKKSGAIDASITNRIQELDIKLTQTSQWPFSTQRINRLRKKLGKQHPSQ